MKKKSMVSIFCIFFVVVLVISFIIAINNRGGAYIYFHDTEPIQKIEIVKIISHNDTDFQYITLCEISNTERFLSEFSIVTYKHYLYGQPMQFSEGDIAIMCLYENGDIEYIGHYTQWMVINGESYFGKHFCDKVEFFEFVEKYTSI